MDSWERDGVTHAIGFGSVEQVKMKFGPDKFLLMKTDTVIDYVFGKNCRSGNIWVVYAVEPPQDVTNDSWVPIHELEYVRCDNGWKRVRRREDKYCVDDGVPTLRDNVWMR